jgi:hypothetical protein
MLQIKHACTEFRNECGTHRGELIIEKGHYWMEAEQHKASSYSRRDHPTHRRVLLHCLITSTILNKEDTAWFVGRMDVEVVDKCNVFISL